MLKSFIYFSVVSGSQRPSFHLWPSGEDIAERLMIEEAKGTGDGIQ